MQLINFLLYLCVVIQSVNCSDIIRVNDKNFNELVINSDKYTLVDFYADWCRHCKNLMPTIEELAIKFKEYPDIQIVKINGDDDGKRLVKKFGIDGFPDIKLFHGNDEPIDFHGSRDLKSLSNFIQAISGITLDDNDDDDNFIEMKENTNTTIISINDDNFNEVVTQTDGKTAILFSATWCGTCEKFKPIWEILSSEIYLNDNKTIRFGSVEVGQELTRELKSHFKIKALPTILFFDSNTIDSDGIPIGEEYDGKRELSPLIDHINRNYNLQRNTKGRLLENSGTINHIDTYIQEQRLQGVDNITISISTLNELDKLSNLSDSNTISYYRKLLNCIINGEEDFFQFEFNRLANVLQYKYDELPSRTIDSFERRYNILRFFLNQY